MLARLEDAWYAGKMGYRSMQRQEKMQEGGKKGKRKGFVGLTCILDCVMAVQLRLR